MGVCPWGQVCLLWGSVPACTEADTPPPPCEQIDKQVQKYYLGHNFVAAGKDDIATFDVRMISLIKKSTDWPANYHKTARTFPQIFCTQSFNESADS